MAGTGFITTEVDLSESFAGACRMSGGEVGAERGLAFEKTVEKFRDYDEARAEGFTYTDSSGPRIEAASAAKLPACSPSALSSNYKIPAP